MKIKHCKKCKVELIRFYNKVKRRLLCHDCYKEIHREICREMWENKRDKYNKNRREKYRNETKNT